MDPFVYRNGELHCERAPVSDIAGSFGTPAYIYSASGVLAAYRQAQQAFPGALICFSIKSNGSAAILRLLADEGAGFDVVSGGELASAIAAGGAAQRIVFAGVGKTDEEIQQALDAEILAFNVESLDELRNIDQIAREMQKRAPVCFRINPDVEPHTHAHLTTGRRGTKFGLDLEVAIDALDELRRLHGIRLVGVQMHIGSQILSPRPYVQAIPKLRQFVSAARGKGFEPRYFNIGGGFGIDYTGEGAPSFADFARAILPELEDLDCRVLLEPGRAIVGNNGILLTRVLYVDRAGEKRFVICDAAMNDLIRPVLYGAYHRIWPGSAQAESPSENDEPAEIVGPICEPGDFFAHDRRLPPVSRGDLLAIFTAGAYGFSMASNYNSRPRPCEVLVRESTVSLIRRRETLEDITQGEAAPEDLLHAHRPAES